MHAIEGIEHVALAVKDVQGVAERMIALGLELHHVEELASQGLRSHVYQLPGKLQVELLESTTEGSSISAFLNKKGPGLHHLCLLVESLTDTLEHVKANGFALTNPTPQRDDRGFRVFLHPRTTGGVLIGLVEPHSPQEDV